MWKLKRPFWGVGLLLGLCILGCSDSASLKQVPAQGIILAFGDSLTYGTGVPAEQSYPAVLAELSGRRVVRSGVPGETTEGGLQRLPGVLAEHQPDLVILGLGGNDILRRQSSAAAKANLQRMIEMIQTSGADVLLVGVPDFGLLPSTAELYRELEEELGIAAENEVIARLQRNPSRKSDSVHFNAEGYREMAEAIYASLQEHGAL